MQLSSYILETTKGKVFLTRTCTLVKFVLERDFGVVRIFGVVGSSEVSELVGYTDVGFSFDAAPTIDTVLYFGVSELSEMNEDKIKIDR